MTQADALPDHASVPGRPPNVAVGLLALGVVLELLWPTHFPGGWAHLAVGGLVLAAGILWIRRPMSQFRDAGTNIETWLPTATVVTEGAYARSRNPIYLGMLTIYVGLALLVGSVWALALGLVLFVYLRFFVIAREERYLERKFGERYLAYKARVRRWL